MSAASFFRKNPNCVCVEIIEAKGSTPREQGTKMLVGEHSIFETIGGGQLEYMSIDEARRMIRQGEAALQREIALGPELGQCCGGAVTLRLEMMDQQTIQAFEQEMQTAFEALPQVFIFGAGHVGKALAAAFLLLPVRTNLVETRGAELEPLRERFRGEENIAFIETPLPEEIVRSAPAGSAFIILTHDHALDYLISSAALSRRDAAYVGMIGSKTKRTLFEKFHLGEGGGKTDLHKFTCPIGGASLDKRPQVIAAMTAAEVMSLFSKEMDKQKLHQLPAFSK